ncbi:MAG: hypothetical protein LBR51_03210 [Bacteroidales bacterium]|jgi:hypothetical protein|nr:hypothetical protein [Bacteroidales bacterium]
MKKHLFFSLVGVIMMICLPLSAQEPAEGDTPDYEYGVSLDFQSRYIWRGQALGGSAPCLQPAMYFNWKGLEIGAWGSYSFSTHPYAELDLYLSYTFWDDRFTVIFTDYGFPNEADGDFNFFDYSKHGAHTCELGFSYNGEKKVPISFGIYVNLFGNDAKNENDKNVFSTYAELAYNPTISRIGVDLSVFVGCAINGVKRVVNAVDENGLFIFDENNQLVTDEIAGGFYGNKGFACVNTGLKATKTFSLTKKLSLPVSTALIYNPLSKKAYFTAGVGIAL